MPNQVPPGYSQCLRAVEFFTTRTQYWNLVPDTNNTVTTDGYALATPEVEYVIYVNHTKPFSVAIVADRKDLTATWMDPLSGQTIDDAAGKTYGTGSYTFDPTSTLRSAVDAVLHLHL